MPWGCDHVHRLLLMHVREARLNPSRDRLGEVRIRKAPKSLVTDATIRFAGSIAEHELLGNSVRGADDVLAVDRRVSKLATDSQAA
jgi:hypothetical protein